MWNSKALTKQRTDDFLEVVRESMEEAYGIVSQRDESGRNLLISPYEMFPNGPQDVLFLIWMKAGRAVGHQRAGKWDKADEEVSDILNYAAFYHAVRLDWEEQRLAEVTTPELHQDTQSTPNTSERPAHGALRWFRRGGVQTLSKADGVWHAEAGEISSISGEQDTMALCGYSCPRGGTVTRYYDDLYVSEDVLCPNCLIAIP